MGAIFAFLILFGIVKLAIGIVDRRSGQPVHQQPVTSSPTPTNSSDTELISEVEDEESGEFVWHRTIKVCGVTFRDGITNLVKSYHDSIGSEPYNGLTSKEIREELKEFGGRIYEYEGFKTSDFKLVPEPDNPVDVNALKVIVMGHFVGYVSSGYAKQLKKYVINPIYGIGGVAEIYGGNYKYFGETRVQNSKSNFGCKIDLQIKMLD